MRVADFQNPIANMPLMQQMQQSQQTQLQSLPIVITQEFQQESEVERTTVNETEEQEAKKNISDEDENNQQNNHATRQRTKIHESDSEAKEKNHKKVSDGIHGRYLDVQI